MTTAQWTRARSDVKRKTSRNKGRTSTRITGRGELSTLIGAREAHRDAGRVPMAVIDHALDVVRETAHGADGDALARLADRWAQAMGEELPALIGNERNSWAEAGTMPTDPAILASIAATTCGITGGIHPRVDSMLAPTATHKRKRATFPARLAVAKYVKRSGERRNVITTGRRTIRPDVIHPRREQGDRRAPYIWHDMVTEQDRPRLKWTVIELPNVHDDVDRWTVGHGPAQARPLSREQRRALNPSPVTRDSVKRDAGIMETLSATYDHAMAHDEPAGRWEFRTGDDQRGILSISKGGKLNLSGDGFARCQARTIEGLRASLARALAS